jgi:hypothetical protein
VVVATAGATQRAKNLELRTQGDDVVAGKWTGGVNNRAYAVHVASAFGVVEGLGARRS